VTLYSLRQKFFSFVVLWKLEFSGAERVEVALELERAKLLVDDLPHDLVRRHDDPLPFLSKIDGVFRVISGFGCKG
jgi:hypothetical protein